jgi:hypothetical protein
MTPTPSPTRVDTGTYQQSVVMVTEQQTQRDLGATPGPTNSPVLWLTLAPTTQPCSAALWL